LFVSPESEPWGRDNRCDDEPEVIGGGAGEEPKRAGNITLHRRPINL
jgi:hypothetical protein